MDTQLAKFKSMIKILVVIVFFAAFSSMTPANALQLKCQSEVSVTCVAKKCFHEKDESYDTITLLVNLDKKLIIRTATSDMRGERTEFCDITWDYKRTGALSNLSYDAFYICSEDPKFPDTGMITILEYLGDEGTLYTESYHEFGITTSSGSCEVK